MSVYSDVEFIFPPRKSRGDGEKSGQTRRIYAAKKLLTRCEYFQDMFTGGFREVEGVIESVSLPTASPRPSVLHIFPAPSLPIFLPLDLGRAPALPISYNPTGVSFLPRPISHTPAGIDPMTGLGTDIRRMRTTPSTPYPIPTWKKRHSRLRPCHKCLISLPPQAELRPSTSPVVYPRPAIPTWKNRSSEKNTLVRIQRMVKGTQMNRSKRWVEHSLLVHLDPS